MINKIIIVAGDPNSINSELIFKTYKKLNKTKKKSIYLIGNFKLLKDQLKKLKFKVGLTKLNSINNNSNSQNKLKIIDIPLNFNKPFNVSRKEAIKYIKKSLDLAHELAISKKVKGIINCPINKQLLEKSKNKGVTEYLAKKCGITNKSEIMMIHNQKLSVVPITTHIDIKNIEKTLSSNLIIKKVISLDLNFKKIFNYRAKIGLLGLNPHNGEFLKNSKEKLHIIPSIIKLKKKGIKINGPLSPDTVFIQEFKKYDVLVGMYHDQVLSPFKAIFHFDAINVTLGLKYLRVSPDHGPAINLIGKNKANFLSLLKCINFLEKR